METLQRTVLLFEQLRKINSVETPDFFFNKKQEIPPLQVVVSGAVNAGKSAFINALFKQDILPISGTVCTSRITVLKKSRDEKYRVKYDREDELDVMKEFDSSEEFIEYLEEIIGTGKTKLTVVTVEWVGCKLLDLGLEIIDTPGFSESLEVRDEILKYMKAAAATIFIINVEDGCLGNENSAALQELSSSNVHPIFVVNKVDEVPDPRIYKTAKKIDKYHQDHKNTIDRILKNLKVLFPNPEAFFFLLSSLEAYSEDGYSLPFQNFLNSFGCVLHYSLVATCNKYLESSINEASSQLGGIKSEAGLQKCIKDTQLLLNQILIEKEKLEKEIFEELSNSFDEFIDNNRKTLKGELETFETPSLRKDIKESANEQTMNYLLHVLQNKIMQHLQAGCIKKYPIWKAKYCNSIAKVLEDENLYYIPDFMYSSDWSIKGNQLLHSSAFISSWEFYFLFMSIFLNMAALGFFVIFLPSLEGKSQEMWRKSVVKELLGKDILNEVKQKIIAAFGENIQAELNKTIEYLETSKKILQQQLDPNIHIQLTEKIPEITKFYTQLLAAKTTFEHGEPIIDSPPVSIGNSWGLIYKAHIRDKSYFAQIISENMGVSYNYLHSLRSSSLFRMNNGDFAILREEIWGQGELKIAIEGIQPALCNLLVDYPSVDEDTLTTSLIDCFIAHNLAPEIATDQVKIILTGAKDHLLYGIEDIARKSQENCIESMPISFLECVAVTAYTMNSNLFIFLNEDLRSKNRENGLVKWKPYLSLFLRGLKVMKPVTSGTVYRGINFTIPDYQRSLSKERGGIFWYTITSASENIDISKIFAMGGNEKGMVFEISVSQAYSIAWLSNHAEQELIFVPGSCFKVNKLEETDSHIHVYCSQLPSAAYFL